MFGTKPARTSQLTFALVGVLVFAFVSCSRTRPDLDKHAGHPPRLAVLIIFDQMRGDYPSKWQPLFAEGGFNRLASEGAWFTDCHYPHANTITGPGHATCSTGCSPDMHGIIANEWFSRRENREVSCVRNERYEVVPARPGKSTGAASPQRLRVPTLGDVIKSSTAGKGKVVCLSFKDRSAVLPAGKSPDALPFWADKDGQFVTSSYYGKVPRWVRNFNASGFTRQWEGKLWHRSRPDVDYVRWAGFDDMPGEEKGVDQGRTFPHPFGKKPEDYPAAVVNSPMGNEVLLELAKRAIDEEKLGSNDHPDFLSISFSSNDVIGHTWGPDSQEVLDVTLRSDVVMRRLMEHLDARVGKGRWVLALTADHGICPLPEVARARGEDARRIPLKPILRQADAFLEKMFGPKDGDSTKRSSWIGYTGSYMIYLNQKRIASSGVRQQDVEKALAVWLAEQPGIHSAWTREQLEGPLPEDQAIGRRVQRGYHRAESGDVTIVLKRGYLPAEIKMGTTHGGPHDYDTHVPLMVIGPGIIPGIRKDQRVSPEHTSVILATALGLRPPEKAAVVVPKDLFEGK